MKKPLYHKDIMRLLEERRISRREAVSHILDASRKRSNISYESVVAGKRPSRVDRADQELAEKMSRQDVREYWLEKLARNKSQGS